MRIFESHCHLDDTSFVGDLNDTIERARQADVTAIMVVGVDLDSSQRAVAIAEEHPGVFASVGIHPHDAKICSDDRLLVLKKLAGHPKVKAWGEAGLDFNRMYSPRADQESCLIRQLETASELGLPMIFHERESQGRFLEILKAHWQGRGKGVVHCFSGNAAELETYLEMGLYIGVTGILTIKSRGEALRRLVRHVPSDRLLVETDAPYLTPTPERNKHRRNEPAFVRTVLEKLASVRGDELPVLAAATWKNTCDLFGLPELV